MSVSIGNPPSLESCLELNEFQQGIIDQSLECVCEYVLENVSELLECPLFSRLFVDQTAVEAGLERLKSTQIVTHPSISIVSHSKACFAAKLSSGSLSLTQEFGVLFPHQHRPLGLGMMMLLLNEMKEDENLYSLLEETEGIHASLAIVVPMLHVLAEFCISGGQEATLSGRDPTPASLLQSQNAVNDLSSHLKVSQWMRMFQSDDAAVIHAFESIYGSDRKVIRQRCELLLGAMENYVGSGNGHSYDDMVSVIRCPARINLRGMHIDSHGGACNAVAIDRETIVVFKPNAESSMARVTNDSWDSAEFDLKDQESMDNAVSEGSWIRYVVGAARVLQEHFAGFEDWKGFDLSVSSDIPFGCGLSSSHALVLGVLQCILASNGLRVERLELVTMAKMAEGKAGASTGLGDQGAMMFAKRNKIVHANFYDDDLEGIDAHYVEFPSEFQLLVVDSKLKRDLSGDNALGYALPRFAYTVGLGLIRAIASSLYPQSFVEELDRLSHISPVRFVKFGGVAAIYRLLKKIPEKATASELLEQFPEIKESVEKATERFLAPLGDLGMDPETVELDLRGPLLFGIAECERAECFFALLQQAEEGDDDVVNQAAELMSIGHRGDCNDEPMVVSDSVLDGLIEASEKKAEGVENTLQGQPGAFRASRTLLDELQSRFVELGAAGASLTGAGMGGAVVGLVPHDCAEEVIETMDAFRVVPVAGCGFIHGSLFDLARHHVKLQEQWKSIGLADQSAIQRSMNVVELMARVRKQMDSSARSPSVNARAESERGWTVLVTGAAGFIGSNLAKLLLDEGHSVVGLDNLNSYYDPAIKMRNLQVLSQHPGFSFHVCDLRDRQEMERVFGQHADDLSMVVHLAARAGVRPSMKQPELYRSVNVMGTQNIFDCCVKFGIEDVVYASSSSVYGKKGEGPFSETMELSEPESVYAATKAENEAMARECNEKFGTRLAGLRFFTVDGPMLGGGIGRPDMAIASFVRMLMSNGESPLTMYGDGEYQRDFTFVQDIVAGIRCVMEGSFQAGEKGEKWLEVFNLGEEDTTSVKQVIIMIASELGLLEASSSSVKQMSSEEIEAAAQSLLDQKLMISVEPPKGDVPLTHANIDHARSTVGYDPHTPIESNIRKTVLEFLTHQERCRDKASHRLDEISRTITQLFRRGQFDDNGERMDAEFTQQDLADAQGCVESIMEMWQTSPGNVFLGRLASFALQVLANINAYLVAGFQGVLNRSLATSVIDRIRGVGDNGHTAQELELLLADCQTLAENREAKRIIAICPAAGYGGRMEAEVGALESKDQVDLGDSMFLLSLRNIGTLSDTIVVVCSENNKERLQDVIAASEFTAENGYRVLFPIQYDRLGDGDAVFVAMEALEKELSQTELENSMAVVLWSDNPVKHPGTIQDLLCIGQALVADGYAAAALPSLNVPAEHLYSPILRVTSPQSSDKGRVVGNWQKADRKAKVPEALSAASGWGWRNVGIYLFDFVAGSKMLRLERGAFLAKSLVKEWKAGESVKGSGWSPEWYLVDALVRQGSVALGCEIVCPLIARETDRLSVNVPEEADRVREFYRESSPIYSAKVVEKENGEWEIWMWTGEGDEKLIRWFQRGQGEWGEVMEAQKERLGKVLGVEVKIVE